MEVRIKVNVESKRHYVVVGLDLASKIIDHVFALDLMFSEND